MLNVSRQWQLRNAFVLGLVLGMTPVLGWILAGIMQGDVAAQRARNGAKLWGEQSHDRPAGFYTLGLRCGSVVILVGTCACVVSTIMS